MLEVSLTLETTATLERGLLTHFSPLLVGWSINDWRLLSPPKASAAMARESWSSTRTKDYHRCTHGSIPTQLSLNTIKKVLAKCSSTWRCYASWRPEVAKGCWERPATLLLYNSGLSNRRGVSFIANPCLVSAIKWFTSTNGWCFNLEVVTLGMELLLVQGYALLRRDSRFVINKNNSWWNLV